MINYVGLKNKLTVDVTRALKATKNGKVMISVVLGHNLFVAFALPSTQNILRLLKKKIVWEWKVWIRACGLNIEIGVKVLLQTAEGSKICQNSMFRLTECQICSTFILPHLYLKSN